MFSGNEFTFIDLETEYITVYLSQGQTDLSAASWPKLLMHCSNQCSIYYMAEVDVVGYILIIFALALHV